LTAPGPTDSLPPQENRTWSVQMTPGDPRRTKANVAWLSGSVAFVAMLAYGAYGADALRDANGQQPPWQALAVMAFIGVVALRRYFLGPLDPEGTPRLRTRIAAGALPVAACIAGALSILLAAKAAYMTMATARIDAVNGWRIAEAIVFAVLALAAWRRWKRRRA
jgi:hypothetical protein